MPLLHCVKALRFLICHWIDNRADILTTKLGIYSYGLIDVGTAMDHLTAGNSSFPMRTNSDDKTIN